MLTYFSYNCNSNTYETDDNYCEVLHRIIKKNAEEYIVLVGGELEYPVYVYAELQDNKNKDYYHVHMYIFTILLEELNSLPYSFSVFEHNGRNVIYYFDKQATSCCNHDLVKKEDLIKNKLISTLDSAKDDDVAYLVNSIESIDFLLCKDDLSSQVKKTPASARLQRVPKQE